MEGSVIDWTASGVVLAGGAVSAAVVTGAAVVGVSRAVSEGVTTGEEYCGRVEAGAALEVGAYVKPLPELGATFSEASVTGAATALVSGDASTVVAGTIRDDCEL